MNKHCKVPQIRDLLLPPIVIDLILRAQGKDQIPICDSCRCFMSILNEHRRHYQGMLDLVQLHDKTNAFITRSDPRQFG